jgi:Ribonuclease G/E
MQVIDMTNKFPKDALKKATRKAMKNDKIKDRFSTIGDFGNQILF